MVRDAQQTEPVLVAVSAYHFAATRERDLATYNVAQPARTLASTPKPGPEVDEMLAVMQPAAVTHKTRGFLFDPWNTLTDNLRDYGSRHPQRLAPHLLTGQHARLELMRAAAGLEPAPRSWWPTRWPTPASWPHPRPPDVAGLPVLPPPTARVELVPSLLSRPEPRP